jgi:hypothetical protein
MKILDQFCALALFILAIVYGLLVPKTYTGRIWIFGTCLGLLFAAMFNWLRIRNASSVRSLRISCITGNVTMLALACSLIASIGKGRSLANPEVPLIGVLLLIETAFSLKKTSDSPRPASM